MNLIHGFNASGTFYDDVNFPHGFSKSGFFSIPESELLETLGRRMYALEQGVVQPDSPIEQSFLEVCKEQKKPHTRAERVWHKYKKHAHRKATVTLGSLASESSARGSYDEDGI